MVTEWGDQSHSSRDALACRLSSLQFSKASPPLPPFLLGQPVQRARPSHLVGHLHGVVVELINSICLVSTLKCRVLCWAHHGQQEETKCGY